MATMHLIKTADDVWCGEMVDDDRLVASPDDTTCELCRYRFAYAEIMDQDNAIYVGQERRAAGIRATFHDTTERLIEDAHSRKQELEQ